MYCSRVPQQQIVFPVQTALVKKNMTKTKKTVAYKKVEVEKVKIPIFTVLSQQVSQRIE